MKTLRILAVLVTTFFIITGLKAEQLTILHINDHHSHLKPDSRMSLVLEIMIQIYYGNSLRLYS